MGIGAFNLARAEAYRAAGGHEALRLTVNEADWFGSAGGMLRALEKNSFASLDYRLGRLARVVPYAAVWLAAVVGPWTGTAAGVAAGAAMMLTAIPAARLASRMGIPRRAAWIAPLCIPVLLAAMLNSAYRTLRQGGVRWRDTFHRLDELRAGNYR